MKTHDENEKQPTNDPIRIPPSSKDFNRRKSIKELMAEMPEDYEPHDVDRGRPVGHEVW